MVEVAAAPLQSFQALAVASQWQLMWWAFSRHRLAMVGLSSPSSSTSSRRSPASSRSTIPRSRTRRAAYHPPQALHFFDTQRGRQLVVPALIPSLQADARPADARRRSTADDNAARSPCQFFGQGYEYELFGLFTTTTHLLASDDPAPAAVPARRRPARPRRVQPHHAGRADLAVDRPRRRAPVADPRRRARRHLGLLRRPDRLRHPARHRVRPVAADASRSGSALAAALPQDWPATLPTIS